MSECSTAAKIQAALDELADGHNPIRCDSAEELDGIRADVLVNFGKDSPHAKHGFTVEDVGSTRNLVITVLDILIKRMGDAMQRIPLMICALTLSVVSAASAQSVPVVAPPIANPITQPLSVAITGNDHADLGELMTFTADIKGTVKNIAWDITSIDYGGTPRGLRVLDGGYTAVFAGQPGLYLIDVAVSGVDASLAKAKFEFEIIGRGRPRLPRKPLRRQLSRRCRRCQNASAPLSTACQVRTGSTSRSSWLARSP